MLVLAVDVHQPSAQGAQLLYGHGAAVDPGPRAALAADHPAQVAFAVGRQVLFLQPAFDLGQGREVEACGHLGPLAAMADEAGVGAFAQRQAEGIDQDRLARARLAGQHRHAGADLQLQRLHDDEVADVDVGQHAPFPVRFIRSGRPSRTWCAGYRSSHSPAGGSAAAGGPCGGSAPGRPAAGRN